MAAAQGGGSRTPPMPPFVSKRTMRRTNSTIIDGDLQAHVTSPSVLSPLCNAFAYISSVIGGLWRRRSLARPISVAHLASTSLSPSLSLAHPSDIGQTFVDPILTFDPAHRPLFGAASSRGIRSYNEDTFRVITDLEAYATALVTQQRTNHLKNQDDVDSSGTMRTILDTIIRDNTIDADAAPALAAWTLPPLDVACAARTPSVLLGGTSQYYGVYDGHAGRRCSYVVSQVLPMCVAAADAFKTNVGDALFAACLQMDKLFLNMAATRGYRDGCTAITVVVRKDEVTIANIGDCRAVLCSEDPVTNQSKTTALTTDQKPNCAAEKMRIEAAGGIVLNIRGIPRVNGMLAVARAFGDLPLKRYQLSIESIEHFTDVKV
ncbi:hypothetical protein DYB36_006614 [Aphanomyces astaci]|uniref:PPM-type phosphatase domain-containing protein n=1 Tax=Aphanomyces astaci TaxID=112090 RepID=A0A397B3L7_APHAT|nr:hypothetical protein DYB36_006614 [Aphanomyces astaci]